MFYFAGVKERLQLFDRIHNRLNNYLKGLIPKTTLNMHLLQRLLQSGNERYMFKPTKWVKKHPEIWNILKSKNMTKQRSEFWDLLGMDAVKESQRKGEEMHERKDTTATTESNEEKKNQAVSSIIALLEMYKSGKHAVMQNSMNKLDLQLHRMLIFFKWRSTAWFAKNILLYNKIMSSEYLNAKTKLRLRTLIYLQPYNDKTSKYICKTAMY